MISELGDAVADDSVSGLELDRAEVDLLLDRMMALTSPTPAVDPLDEGLTVPDISELLATVPPFGVPDEVSDAASEAVSVFGEAYRAADQCIATRNDASTDQVTALCAAEEAALNTASVELVEATIALVEYGTRSPSEILAAGDALHNVPNP